MTARVIRGAGLTSGGYLFAQVLNLGVYVVLSRLLDPVDFGRYASATVLIAFGVLFTESGMQAAIIQRRDRLDEAMSTAAAATFIGGILLSLGALAIAPILGAVFNDSQVTLLAAAASGLIFVNTLSVVPNAILQRRFSSVRLTVVDPLEVVAFGIVSIALAARGYGPWALVIGQYAAFVTSTSLVWIFARWRPRAALMSYRMWRELASYSRHVLLSSAISRFGGQMADTVIVGRSLGPASLGQFRYALRIAMLPWSVAQTGAGYVLFPALARISADRQRLQAAFLRSLRWMVAIGFPAGMVLVPLGAVPDSSHLRPDLAPGRPRSGRDVRLRGRRGGHGHGGRAPEGTWQPRAADSNQPGERDRERAGGSRAGALRSERSCSRTVDRRAGRRGVRAPDRAGTTGRLDREPPQGDLAADRRRDADGARAVAARSPAPASSVPRTRARAPAAGR